MKHGGPLRPSLSWTVQKAKSQPLVLSRCPDKPDWINLRGIKIDVDEGRGFTVKAAYNATDLVLRYEVRSPFELVNSTPEQNMLFKGGNLLSRATCSRSRSRPDAPAAGARRHARAGDAPRGQAAGGGLPAEGRWFPGPAHCLHLTYGPGEH